MTNKTNNKIIPTNNNSLPYRKCVGIALFNKDGKVFAAERKDINGAWQMPQGGIDDNENVKQAAIRELKEEIGTDNVEILDISKSVIRYEWPNNTNIEYYKNKYKGQEQYWVAARFKGDDSEIKLDEHDEIEFQDWKWVDLKDMPEIIVPFKKNVYIQVVKMFSKYSS